MPAYGEKIRLIREIRGYSQEYVATKLAIAQNTYSKIENNQTKLTAEMLQSIAEVLEVSPMDIMSNMPAIVNLQPNQGTQGIGHIEHFHTFQKETFDKLIASKDSEISGLKEIIAGLIKDKEGLMEVIKTIGKKD